MRIADGLFCAPGVVVATNYGWAFRPVWGYLDGQQYTLYYRTIPPCCRSMPCWPHVASHLHYAILNRMGHVISVKCIV